MRNHTCLLDHHQRSHHDRITIGPEGKFNWVLQLNNNQKVRLFDSLEEVQQCVSLMRKVLSIIWYESRREVIADGQHKNYA